MKILTLTKYFPCVQMLPKVAAEVAAPMTQTKKITMISDGNSKLGASKLTEEVLTIMDKIPETVAKMTGVDITKQISTPKRRQVYRVSK